MSNLAYKIWPVFYGVFIIAKNSEEVIKLLNQKISRDNNLNFPYTGTVGKDKFQFSKKNISLNVKSELKYTGKIIPENNNKTRIEVYGNYKIIPLIWYLLIIGLFITLVWPLNHIAKPIIPLLPYLVMLYKIKTKSSQILSDLEAILK